MENIDYFVIEPGVLEFSNGAKLVAGTVSYNRTFSNIGGGANVSKSVRYSDFGLSSNFSSSPGVLVQVQSMNNMVDGEPLWLTPIALNPSSSSFNLALDRSEVTQNAQLGADEQVAFVAGLGEGFVNGRKFWLGQGATDNTLGIDDRVIKPIAEGCQLVSDFTATGFSSIPTLLASKRTRNGNNGGWLRRCSVSKTGVALINEEDMANDYERAHVVEPYSYFLFDKPPANEICELFPSPAQTWVGNTSPSLSMSNTSKISGTPVSNGRRYVGFPQSSISLSNQASCDGSECYGDTGLQVNRQELESFQDPDDGLENVSVSQDDREYSNSESFGNLSVGKGTVTFGSGTYWIDRLDINNAGRVIIPDGEQVIIHIRQLSLSNNDSFFGEEGDGQLIVLVHDLQGANINLANSTEFKGLLYSEIDVRMSNSSIVHGAVTAKSITMSNSSQIIATDNHCFQPSDDYNVSITPATDLALICGSEQPEFTITTTNNGTATGLGVSVSLSPTSSDGDFSLDVIEGGGTGSDGSFTSNLEGLLKLGISVENPENISLEQIYSINVVMVDDGSKSASAQYQFVPFKFDVPNIDIFAGENGEVPISVKGCDESDEINVRTYTGTPEINYSIETAGSLEPWELDFQPKFELGDDGEITESIKILESGQFDIELEDSEFDCSGLDNCPIDGIGILRGSFTLRSAPWKIAICNVISENGDSNPGKTNQIGGGFVNAGTPFSVNYRPIQHPDSNSGDECSYNITTNYALDSGPYQLDTALSYPSGGTLGDFEPLITDSFTPDLVEGGGDGTKQVIYTWNEVGTLGFTTSGEYLGITITEGMQDIGRFYPALFRVIDTSWSYPHDDFAYMGQPFDGVEYEVEALNSDKHPTVNYAAEGYSDALQAKFHLFDNDVRFSAPLEVNSEGWVFDKVKRAVVGTFSYSSSDSCENGVCWKKAPDFKPDGPFNVDRGSFNTSISVTGTSADHRQPEDINYVDGKQLLTEQPELRFGRLSLKDVGGAAGGKLTVPLSVEYWDGAQFITNTDDSETSFDGAHYCFSSEGDGGELFGGDTVHLGTSQQLIASQYTSEREQIRFWLTLGDPEENNNEASDCSAGNNAIPWLRYNWDGEDNDEEDPSTLVTFGVYRGNDRIIFRGEPGLTGQ
ncbi:DUF6701 domain-containing protein [Vibrio astriarenae]